MIFFWLVWVVLAVLFLRNAVRSEARLVYDEENERRAALLSPVLRRTDNCECNIPNAGLPLTGDEICRVCRKKV